MGVEEDVSSEDELWTCTTCLIAIPGMIWQCQNGHIICGDCHVQCKASCPTCLVPLEGIRNRALEQVRDKKVQAKSRAAAPGGESSRRQRKRKDNRRRGSADKAEGVRAEDSLSAEAAAAQDQDAEGLRGQSDEDPAAPQPHRHGAAADEAEGAGAAVRPSNRVKVVPQVNVGQVGSDKKAAGDSKLGLGQRRKALLLLLSIVVLISALGAYGVWWLVLREKRSPQALTGSEEPGVAAEGLGLGGVTKRQDAVSASPALAVEIGTDGQKDKKGRVHQGGSVQDAAESGRLRQSSPDMPPRQESSHLETTQVAGNSERAEKAVKADKTEAEPSALFSTSGHVGKAKLGDGDSVEPAVRLKSGTVKTTARPVEATAGPTATFPSGSESTKAEPRANVSRTTLANATKANTTNTSTATTTIDSAIRSDTKGNASRPAAAVKANKGTGGASSSQEAKENAKDHEFQSSEDQGFCLDPEMQAMSPTGLNFAEPPVPRPLRQCNWRKGDVIGLEWTWVVLADAMGWVFQGPLSDSEKKLPDYGVWVCIYPEAIVRQPCSKVHADGEPELACLKYHETKKEFHFWRWNHDPHYKGFITRRDTIHAMRPIRCPHREGDPVNVTWEHINYLRTTSRGFNGTLSKELAPKGQRKWACLAPQMVAVLHNRILPKHFHSRSSAMDKIRPCVHWSPDLTVDYFVHDLLCMKFHEETREFRFWIWNSARTDPGRVPYQKAYQRQFYSES